MKKKIAPKVIEYNPAHEAHGYKNVRWVENASRGLRLVGFADEIAREAEHYPCSIRHKGWFTDEDIGEVYRGIVYQLPSRGEPAYVYGYADPDNDDCALLCFDTEADKLDAAKAADRFAELFAEEQREYTEAWQAGRRVEAINEEITESRTNVLKIGAEMREGRKAGLYLPTACEALRRDIARAYRFIQKLRKERDDLIDTFGQHPGFVE